MTSAMFALPHVDWPAVAKMPDGDAALLLDGYLRSLDTLSRRVFIVRGLILLEVETRRLWVNLEHSSFERYVVDACDYSRRDCFYALAAAKELKDVPRQELEKMTRANIGVLQSLSSGVRTHPEVIHAAQTLTEDQFINEINERHPDQHVESRQRITMKPTKSAREVIDRGIEVGVWVFGTDSREDVMEAVFAAWLEDLCEVEGFQGMSNRDAFAAAKQQGRVA